MNFSNRGGIGLGGMFPNDKIRVTAGPKPKASKPWHKIVVDIVFALLFLGAIAWFFFGVIM